jgi:hypothetical protein
MYFDMKSNSNHILKYAKQKHFVLFFNVDTTEFKLDLNGSINLLKLG